MSILKTVALVASLTPWSMFLGIAIYFLPFYNAKTIGVIVAKYPNLGKVWTASGMLLKCKTAQCTENVVATMDAHASIVYLDGRDESTYDVSHAGNIGNVYTNIDKNTVWARLNNFSDGDITAVGDAFYEALKGASTIILDVRHNTGGKTELGYGLASLFLQKGTAISSWKHHLPLLTVASYFVTPAVVNGDGLRSRTALVKSSVLSKPLPRLNPQTVYILIDEYTASSAEIFTYVIKHYAKQFNVVIVGDTPTYGVLDTAGLNPVPIGNNRLLNVPFYYTGFPKRVVPDISNEEFVALNPSYVKIFNKNETPD